MPLPSAPVNGLRIDEWRLAVEGPVQEAFLTGDQSWFYVWATDVPELDSIVGHYVPARDNETVVVPAGMGIWVRAASAPCNLTITIEPVAA